MEQGGRAFIIIRNKKKKIFGEARPCWRKDKNNTQHFLHSGANVLCLCEETGADVNVNVLCVETGSSLLLQMDMTE